MPDPFISTSDLVDYLGRGGTADPGMIIATDSACEICRTIAEQDFNAGTATIALDGNGGDALALPQYPIRGVGTVTVDGTAEADFMTTDAGLLLRGTAGQNPRPVWPLGRQNIELTYEYGYLDIPRDVRAVALQLAARMAVQGPVKQESIGSVSVSYSEAAMDLTANELRILRKYRRTRSF